MKTYVIKIPKNVAIFYCKTTNFLVVHGLLGQRALKTSKEFSFISINRNLVLKNECSVFLTKKTKKVIVSSTKTLRTLIKKSILEVSICLLKKLKFIGLGYKFFLIDSNLNLLHLKLGYSHSVYFYVPSTITLNFNKNTILYFKSNDYYNLTQTLSKIKSNKIPDLYKGKGILYENEIIQLKKGKKI